MTISLIALKGSSSPTTSCVHSINSLVPVSCDQQRGSCCLVTGFSSHSTGSASSSVPVTLFSPLGPVHLVSPLQFSHFQAELCDYPDQTAAAYVLTGLREGFHIGFETSSVTLRSASSNMRSALVHPSVIDAYLETEVSHGKVAGPFTFPPYPNLHVSCFGVIPKATNQVNGASSWISLRQRATVLMTAFRNLPFQFSVSRLTPL